MKFFVVFACALAVASAGHLVAPLVYGAQHLPVIGPNGVPIDTAEVQHARAAHLAHKVEAHARNGDYAVAHGAYAAPLVSSVYGAQAYGLHGVHGYGIHGPAAYPTTAVLPSSVNGVPLETPEVAAARINHYAAHAEANARNIHAIHYRKRRGIYAPIAYAAQHLPIIGANGVPVDTAEVQIARAQHLAHKVEAHARNGDYAIAAYAHAPLVASTYAHAAPVLATSYANSYLNSHAYSAAPWAQYY